jgi:predicted dinucleotide-binding enzyme
MTAEIGIIGSGAVGRALAAQLIATGRDVVLCNSRGPETLKAVVRELGPRAEALDAAAVAAADVVFLAVPWRAVVTLLEELPPWHGRILVDATEPIHRRHRTEPELYELGGLTSSEVVQAAAAGARVVKAFGTLPAAVLASGPATGAGRRVMFLSGNDPDARAVVTDLITDIGYAPIDLGSLASGSALQQSGGPLAGVDLRVPD